MEGRFVYKSEIKAAVSHLKWLPDVESKSGWIVPDVGPMSGWHQVKDGSVSIDVSQIKKKSEEKEFSEGTIFMMLANNPDTVIRKNFSWNNLRFLKKKQTGQILQGTTERTPHLIAKNT